MQNLHKSISVEPNSCQAAKVFKMFLETEAVLYEREQAIQIANKYTEHFQTNLAWDRDDVTVYQDGSVFLEHKVC